MQSDAKFNEALDYLVAQLRSLQLPDSRWAAEVSSQLDIACSADNVRPLAVQFPEPDSATRQFDVAKLRSSLEDLLAGGDSPVKVSVGELASVSQQLQLLLDLQRYVGRRRVGRARRIVNAAHRRAILTHPRGPINAQLRAVVDEQLVQAR